MTVWVEESGVRFGPFEECNIFRVEHSPGMSGLGENLKKVEFALSMPIASGGARVVFVEAKASIPRDTDAFFRDIRDKMLHSMTAWFMALVGKHRQLEDELPSALRGPELIHNQIDLILVAPPIPDQNLSAVTDKFRAVMIGDMRAWGIEPINVRVLNESRAQRYGLIQP